MTVRVRRMMTMRVVSVSMAMVHIATGVMMDMHIVMDAAVRYISVTGVMEAAMPEMKMMVVPDMASDKSHRC